MTAKGHTVRRNSAEAEAIAQRLQHYAAKRFEEEFDKHGFASGEGIPVDAVISALSAQVVSPTRNANHAIAATGKLISIAGLGDSAKKKVQEEIDRVMAEIRSLQPSGPRLVRDTEESEAGASTG